MIQGLNASAAGLQAQQTRFEVTANNLANLSTTGFRRHITTFASMPFAANMSSPMGNVAQPANAAAQNAGKAAISSDTNPESVARGATSSPFRLALINSIDQQDGATRSTGNPSDLAITGDAYFSVLQGNGSELYTRDGAFQVDTRKLLSTRDDNPVLGEHGAITINSPNWKVLPDGGIMVNGAVVDHLKLMTFNPMTAIPQGNNLLFAAGATPATSARVSQGNLEESNVNGITEMVNMMTITRNFEANQRCLQAQDDTLEQAVTQIAHV